MTSTLVPQATPTVHTVHTTPAVAPEGPRRRYRREASVGERCPQCAGPLVFGEGCSLCPVCGYSACGG